MTIRQRMETMTPDERKAFVAHEQAKAVYVEKLATAIAIKSKGVSDAAREFAEAEEIRTGTHLYLPGPAVSDAA